MKRRDNSTLVSSGVFFQRENSEDTAADLIGAALAWTTVKRMRVFLSGGLDDYPRAFFQYPAEQGLAKLKAYSHEARTAVYETEGREVTLTLGRNWADFDRFGEFEHQYKAANGSFKLRFGFEFLNSPTLTGLYALESSLPYKIPSLTASLSFRALLHSQTTQGRSEMFWNRLPQKFFYYDRRFAYAADAKLELPCGEPVETQGGELVDYETAFYRVEFDVPENWPHVGLLPVLNEKYPDFEPVGGWTWPIRGSHLAFVATPELQLAKEWGWRFRVLNKWRFQAQRPMEKFVKTLEGLWKVARDERQLIEADIYRRLALHAIGGLYARSFERERFVDFAELIERNDAAALNAELTDAGAMVVERSGQRDERFYMPEWTAFIWSRARARLNKALLLLPCSSLVGCHVDAIYSETNLSHCAPELVGGNVGQFRLKGYLGRESRVESKADLTRVRTEAEKMLASMPASMVSSLQGGE